MARDRTIQYEEAFDEWADSGEADVWDVTVGDGLLDELALSDWNRPEEDEAWSHLQ